MGECAELCAERYGFTREQQDAHALESVARARSATAAGLVDWEIAPVELPASPRGKGGGSSGSGVAPPRLFTQVQAGEGQGGAGRGDRSEGDGAARTVAWGRRMLPCTPPTASGPLPVVVSCCGIRPPMRPPKPKSYQTVHALP